MQTTSKILRLTVFWLINLQVKDPDQALRDLEAEVGFPVQGYVEGTMSVPRRLQLEEKQLKSYLNWALKLHSKGIYQPNYKAISIWLLNCIQKVFINPITKLSQLGS